MDIRKNEFRKILYQPVLWCLVLIFIIMNYHSINSILNDKLTNELKDYHTIMTDLGTDLSKNNEYIEPLLQDEDEMKSFYAMTVNSGRELYKNLDMIKVKEIKQELMKYYPKGSFKAFVDNNYKKLQQRVETIRTTGEGDNAFYFGKAYKIHFILYSDLIRNVILQMIVIMALCILFIMDYERNQKTTDIVLTCKLGRNIMLIKAMSGIIVGIMYGIILMVMTIIRFFSKVSFKGLWDVPISSCMLSERRGIFYYPYITYEKITVKEYFISTCMIAFSLVLLVGILTVAIQFLVNNSYLTFLIEAIILFAMYSLIFYSTATWFDVFIDLNPVNIWFICGNWFMENNMASSFEGKEWISVILSFCTTSLMAIIFWKKYKKRDLINRFS